MRKKWMGLPLALMLAIGLAACGGGGDNADNNNTGNDTGGETATNDAEEIVKNNCISCHGENLEGKNGPELAHIGAELSKDDILEVIENGRTGMPPNIITGDDADKVAQWLSEKK
ncbi:cytochrome c551 [Bacillus sp. SD088]|uniref:cytochrome c551 n=1 Tax=Bacillus sp. SD088 TaxID=2782012 RepID=UPI001A95C23A|nr:cytochrome c [Bacillus sp. SD088]MBO0992200.1 cytochrome c [Bacillus sp. SD088]